MQLDNPPIEALLKMIIKTGIVVVGKESVEAVGFDFDYDNELFDGCRMGQLLPLLFLKAQVDKKLVDYMAAASSQGIEDASFMHWSGQEVVNKAICNAAGIEPEEIETYFVEQV